MKRYLLTLAVFVVWPSAERCCAQATDTVKIIRTLNKCWRAISHEYATIYGLEEDEIKSYSRQKLCFSRDSVVMYDGALYDPKYSIKKVNAELFAKDNFDCTKERLGMSRDSVYEITIASVSKSPETGKQHKMKDIIAFDGDCIYVVKDGVIFKLFDSEAKNEARSGN